MVSLAARWGILVPDNIDGQRLDQLYGFALKEYKEEEDAARKRSSVVPVR